jgi:predicted Zn-dependent protease
VSPRQLGLLASAADVVERALSISTTDGCVVVVEDRGESEVRFANNTTTTNGRRRDRRVTVVSLAAVPGGVGVGVASRSGAGDVADLVAAAEADARAAPAAEDAVPLVDGGAARDFTDEPELGGVGPVAAVAGGLGDAFARARSAGYVLAGFATQECATTYLGTSSGTRRRHAQSTGTVEMVGRSRDGAESAWAATGGEQLDVASVASLHGELDRRLGWAKRKVELPAGRYDVVLPPDAVADLMVVLAEAASGRDAEDGRSVFSRPGGGTRLGDVLSTLPFELSADPSTPGLECAPFLVAESSSTDVSVFDNGVSLGPVRYVADGKLERLRYHRAGAARSGALFTPPVDNLTLSVPGASATTDDLVAASGRALLLTCLWYIREVDVATLLLTGLTRDGVYLVEDGEVVGAVNNFRFNESPVDVLGRATAAGRSERALSREWGEWMSRTAMPPLAVTEFNMSSVSPAS